MRHTHDIWHLAMGSIPWSSPHSVTWCTHQLLLLCRMCITAGGLDWGYGVVVSVIRQPPQERGRAVTEAMAPAYDVDLLAVMSGHSLRGAGIAWEGGLRGLGGGWSAGAAFPSPYPCLGCRRLHEL